MSRMRLKFVDNYRDRHGQLLRAAIATLFGAETGTSAEQNYLTAEQSGAAKG